MSIISPKEKQSFAFNIAKIKTRQIGEVTELRQNWPNQSWELKNSRAPPMPHHKPRPYLRGCEQP